MISLLGILAAWLVVGQAAPAAGAERATGLPISLVGLVVNAAAPDRSVCLLKSPAQDGTVIAQPGDEVFRMAVVRSVEPESVLLKNLVTGDIETLGFWNGRPPQARPASLPKPRIAAEAAGPSGPQRVVVPKSVVEHYKANLKEFLDSASATPHFGGGGIDGFEIGSVKSGGIVDQLGFKAGDVLTEVNGVRLDGIEKVLALVPKVQTATNVEIVFLRDGKRQTISFSQK